VGRAGRAGQGRDRDPADHEPDDHVRPPSGRRSARGALPERVAQEARDLGRVGLLNTGRSSSEWADVYADLQPAYRDYTARLGALFETLLDDEDLSYIDIFGWTVDIGSFEEALDRAAREGRRIDDPLLDLRDIAGVTLVGHTLEQTARLAEVVERELDVDHGRSVTFAEANAGSLDAGNLKYPYAQYRVKLDENRAGLPEWKRFAGLTVQVDVQTRLQQTWEKIDSTSLAFHWPTSYAAGVHEHIARALEHIVEADRELAAAEGEAWALARRYGDSIANGDLELNLNGSSLAAYLRTSEVVSELVRIGEEAGLQRDEEPEEPGDWAVEQRHLWLLSRVGLTTIPELDSVLRASLGRAPDILGELARVAGERDVQPYATRESVVAWILLVLNRADSHEVNLTSFAEEIEYALNTLIGNPLPPPPEQA
jgi:hypothetical protein